MENLYIARQPIYNKSFEVFGYELLYRNGAVNEAIIDDANQATCETILNAFMHIGIDSLVGSTLAFINLPKEFIINESLTPLFNSQIVLEILEDVEPTPEVIDGLKRLKKQGFKIALDDFVYRDSLQPLFELADIVKLNVIALSEELVREEYARFRQFEHIKILAEKVETQEMKELCIELGFDYIQGFFFCKPQLVKQKQVVSNKTVVLNLLNKIQSPDLDYDEFQTILYQDVALSYKLLRYINSATFSLRCEVDSIKDAVVLLGQDNIKKWLSLILMSRMGKDKPNELIVVALTRARMCELLAEELHPDIQPKIFIVGLFSVLDALMDTPMTDLLDTVILSSAIKFALLDHEGRHGEILDIVLAYEQFRFDELDNFTMVNQKLRQYYLDSVEWADQSVKSLQ
ncbi:MAG: EAL and modified HD-GYP domain-containing signal transduction protein [Polaribacter sp.]|jgi:EAL and modified HD-GYP domain-containing signal transduction protein